MLGLLDNNFLQKSTSLFSKCKCSTFMQIGSLRLDLQRDINFWYKVLAGMKLLQKLTKYANFNIIVFKFYLRFDFWVIFNTLFVL